MLNSDRRGDVNYITDFLTQKLESKKKKLTIHEDENLTSEEIVEQLDTNPVFLPTYEQCRLVFPRSEMRRSEWWWMERNLTAEVYNREYINAYADHLSSELEKILKEKEGTVGVIEVGSGIGKLTFLLSETVLSKYPDYQDRVSFIATDKENLARKGLKKKHKKTFFVENLDYRDAVDKYSKLFNHIIIISSWPPRRPLYSLGYKDWTSYYREKKVHSYYVSGDYRMCGDSGQTFGVNEMGVNIDNPLYEKDGYRRKFLERVMDYQFTVHSKIGDYKPVTAYFTREGEE